MRWVKPLPKKGGFRGWFAWYPIRVQNTMVWLECVKRKCMWRAVIGPSDYQYKFKEED